MMSEEPPTQLSASGSTEEEPLEIDGVSRHRRLYRRDVPAADAIIFQVCWVPKRVALLIICLRLRTSCTGFRAMPSEAAQGSFVTPSVYPEARVTLRRVWLIHDQSRFPL